MTKCLLFLNLKINILLNINYQLSTLVIKFFKNKVKKEKKKIICFLPGSRNIEIKKKFIKNVTFN